MVGYQNNPTTARRKTAKPSLVHVEIVCIPLPPKGQMPYPSATNNINMKKKWILNLHLQFTTLKIESCKGWDIREKKNR